MLQYIANKWCFKFKINFEKLKNLTISEYALNLESAKCGKQLKEINAEEGVKENGNAKINAKGTTAIFFTLFSTFLFI